MRECASLILAGSCCAGATSAIHRCLQRSVQRAVRQPGKYRLPLPGDARPAFPADVALINTIFQEHFGAPLVPEGHLVLLNKVPDTDPMEEIVIGGGIAGSIRYIPKERRWEPIPRPKPGAFRPQKRCVVVDDSAVPFIRDQGMSVLRPGLDFVDDEVRKGDEVFVLTKTGECIAVGRAKVGAEEARAMLKGQIVRNRKNVPSTMVQGKPHGRMRSGQMPK